MADLPLNRSGSFFNINCVISSIYTYNYLKFHVYFFQESGPDARDWNKVFEQPFGITTRTNRIINPVRDGLMNRREQRNGYVRLLTPSKADRRVLKGIIDKHIRPLPHIQNQINILKEKLNGYYKIGLHIRGGGREDGGTKEDRQVFELTNGIPLKEYCKIFDKIIENKIIENTNREIKVYLATDNEPTVDYFKTTYPQIEFILQDCIRSKGWYGEEHMKSNCEGQRLFEEVVIDAFVLGYSDVFIHGNSNVSNFVVCQNPDIINYNIYGY